MSLDEMEVSGEGLLPEIAKKPCVKVVLDQSMAQLVRDYLPGAPVKVRFSGVVKELSLSSGEEAGELEIELGNDFTINTDANNSIAKLFYEDQNG